LTICIAAICNDGEGLVAVADRMVTVQALNIEIERAKSKISKLGPRHLVMSAGDGLVGEEVFRQSADQCSHMQGVDEVANVVVNAFEKLRVRRIEETLLRALGYTVESFQKSGSGQLGQAFGNVLQNIAQYDLKTEFLIPGFDGPSARIAHVHNPGALRWTDGMDFYAVGSGAIHAFTSLLLSGYSSALPVEKALLQVFRAKCAAEIAPGVGHETDLHVGNSSGFRAVEGAVLQELRNLHDTAVASAKSQNYGKLKELLDAGEKGPEPGRSG
jgi:hypothetical protein